MVPIAEDEPPHEEPAQDTCSPSVVMGDNVAESAWRPESPAGKKAPISSTPDSLSTTGVPTHPRDNPPEATTVPHTPDVLRLKIPVDPVDGGASGRAHFG